jgi:lipopolysaccharide/colanic/teichoic acid biosynthesis glycosyltransferase
VRRVARYLTLVGPLLVVLALSKIHARYVADPAYDYTGSFRFAWSLAYAAVLALSAYGFGLPDIPRRHREVWTAIVGAPAVAAVAVSIVQLAVGDLLLPRFVVLGAAVLTVGVEWACWRLAFQGRGRDEERDRLVLVGSAADAAAMERDLAMAPEHPAVMVAHIDIETAAGVQIPLNPGEKPLVAAILDCRATVLVLDRSALAVPRVIDQAASLHESGVRVRTLVELYEGWLGKLPAGELERSLLFFDIGEIHGRRYGRIKRLLDVVLGIVGLFPLAVVVPFVAFGNLLANRGTLLYRQDRVGRGGETFSILKFRTMIPTGPGVIASDWTAADDPRITRFGKILRASHLDELPQVVNILRGDLSVVGPRPEQPRYVSELSAKLPFYGMRHLVRPGLTGWAQVKYGYAGDEDDALEKLQYEFFYLRHQNLRFDLRIIGRTVRSVVGGIGRGR